MLNRFKQFPDAFADWLGQARAFWFCVNVAGLSAIAFLVTLLVKHGVLSLTAAIILGLTIILSQTILQLVSLPALQIQAVKGTVTASVERAENHAEVMAILKGVVRIEKFLGITDESLKNDDLS